MNTQCNRCGSKAIEEVTTGYRVSNVVGVTIDNGLVCDLVTFVPNEDSFLTYYRCKHCQTVLPFTKDELIEFLRGA